MSTTKRSIALYIHPDEGPVLPMELDMMAIEIVVLGIPAGPQREDAFFREIARRITERFPDVDPESNWRELRSIRGRLSHFDLFNGIVLRLPGKINTPASPLSQPSKDAVKELDRLTSQLQQFSALLSKEQGEHSITKSRLYTLESENRRLASSQEKLHQEVATLHIQTQRDQETLTRARTLVKSLRDELEAAQREAAAVKTELEQAQSDQQVAAGFLQEISRLRQEVLHGKKAEQQLRETLAQYEQERDELRTKLKILLENGPDVETNTGNAFGDEPFL